MSAPHLKEVKSEQPEEVNLPVHLNDSDMEYHGEIVKEIKAMGQLEVQMQAIQQEIIRIRGARQTWMQYLYRKYKLADKDSVAEDGAIIRGK